MSRSAVPATPGSSNSVEVLYTLLCVLTMTYYKADTRHETQQSVIVWSLSGWKWRKEWSVSAESGVLSFMSCVGCLFVASVLLSGDLCFVFVCRVWCFMSRHLFYNKRIKELCDKTSLLRRVQAPTLLDEAPSSLFTKISVTFDPMKQFRCPSRLRYS